MRHSALVRTASEMAPKHRGIEGTLTCMREVNDMPAGCSLILISCDGAARALEFQSPALSELLFLVSSVIAGSEVHGVI